MLLYMGGGTALADYYRRRRAAILNDCAVACGELSRSSAGRLGASDGDRSALAAALAAAEDGREVGARAAALMARGSELTGCILAACAAACRRCAEACEPLSDDEAAARCRIACREAEEVCRRAIEALAA